MICENCGDYFRRNAALKKRRGVINRCRAKLCPQCREFKRYKRYTIKKDNNPYKEDDLKIIN
jgi:hypothetical protein